MLDPAPIPFPMLARLLAWYPSTLTLASIHLLCLVPLLLYDTHFLCQPNSASLSWGSHLVQAGLQHSESSARDMYQPEHAIGLCPQRFTFLDDFCEVNAPILAFFK